MLKTIALWASYLIFRMYTKEASIIKCQMYEYFNHNSRNGIVDSVQKL